MIKVKGYATAFIRYNGKDKVNPLVEDWWPVHYSSFSKAKANLKNDIRDINETCEAFGTGFGFTYDKETEQMDFLEIWSVMYHKEHRSDDLEGCEAFGIKCHYVCVPKNCPDKVRELLRKELRCPVVKFKD